LQLWEVATGKTLRTFRGNNWITSVAYSPNGKSLVAGELYNVFTSLRLWDPSSGKEMPVVFPHDLSIHSVAFSPDGKQLLVSGVKHFDEFEVRQLDVATGKLVRALPELQHEVYSVTFSPDGRVFATGSDDKTARLWETDSGRQIHKLPHDEDVRSVAFSPDGALLASGGWGRKVHLWDVLTGKEMHVFRGHRGAIFSVAFAPDGRTLASAGRDASCLVWDAAAPFRTEPLGDRLSDRRREELWATLGGTDALAAWRAMYALVAGSDQNVPFLDRHLQTPLVDPQQLQRWIADLDSDSFVVREKARKELEQQGEVAAPALQQALREKPSLEARKQMKRLLADATTRVPRGEFLAMLRALTVLERIGTVAARQTLEKLARGNPLDRRTREAKAALRRLAARSDTMP
jgi:WD40 repeat protein